MSTSDAFDDHLALLASAKPSLVEGVDRAVDVIAAAFRSGHRLLAFGNGGSAADAQHFVAELVGNFDRPRRGLPAVSLSTDPSVVTSVSNDFGFEQVFSRQVEALATAGDVAIAISTSGRSPNVLAAAAMARSLGCTVVALTGPRGPLRDCADVVIDVPSTDTQRIQEMHGLCLHAIVAGVETALDGA